MPRSCCQLTILAAAAVAASAAAAEEGLKVPGVVGWVAWPTTMRFHATVHDSLPRSLASLTALAPAERATGVSLIGDYYLFGDPQAAAAGWTSGLRASSGLLIRQPGLGVNDQARSSRASASGAPTLGSAAGTGFGPAPDPAADGFGTLPYVGLGYSSPSVRSGWGFWADVGVLVQSPGGALGLGRTLVGSQGADDLIRELRLSPMLQLGISYAF